MKGQTPLEETANKESRFTRRTTGASDQPEPTGQQAEKLLWGRGLSFRAIYENTPVMMHSTGRSRRIVSVDRNWLEALGYEEKELIGRKAKEFLTEASRRYAEEVSWPKFLKAGQDPALIERPHQSREKVFTKIHNSDSILLRE